MYSEERYCIKQRRDITVGKMFEGKRDRRRPFLV